MNGRNTKRWRDALWLFLASSLFLYSCDSRSSFYKVSLQFEVQGKNGPQIDQALQPIFQQVFATATGKVNSLSVASPEAYAYTIEFDGRVLPEANAYNLLQINLRSLEPALEAFGAHLKSIAPPVYQNTAVLTLQLSRAKDVPQADFNRVLETLEGLIAVNWIDRSEQPCDEVAIYLRRDDMARQLITNQRVLLQLEELTTVNRSLFEGTQSAVEAKDNGVNLSILKGLLITNARSESVALNEFSDVVLQVPKKESSAFEVRIYGSKGISLEALHETVSEAISKLEPLNLELSYGSKVVCLLTNVADQEVEPWQDKIKTVLEPSEFEVLEPGEEAKMTEYTLNSKQLFESGIRANAIQKRCK